MTESGRKRISKWDIKEVPHLSPAEYRGAELGRPGNKELQPRWHNEKGSLKEGRESLDATMLWDEDSTKMSPGLDDWRKQKRNRSPESRGRSHRSRSSRSRSRSRSPQYGLKRKDSNDRSIEAQPCKDFHAGRCRRGNLCPYIHQYKDTEDRTYTGSGPTNSWEERQKRNDASTYFTSGDTREQSMKSQRSNDLSRQSANAVSRERESERFDRINSFDKDRSLNSHSSTVLCKFFSAGNCRKGKCCRFSHNIQTPDSFDNRVRHDWRHGMDVQENMASLRECSRRSGTTGTDVVNRPKWNEEKSEGFLGVPDQRAQPISMNNSFSTDNRFVAPQIYGDNAMKNTERGYFQPTADDTGFGTGVESRGASIRVGDVETSSAWHYELPSSNDRNAIRDSGVPHIDVNISAHVSARENLDPFGQNSPVVTQQLLGLNAVEQNHQIYASYAPTNISSTYSGNLPTQDGTSGEPDFLDTIKSGLVSHNPSAPNIMSNDQLANLTVALSQLLGRGEQLPGFMQSSVSESTAPAAFPDCKSEIPSNVPLTGESSHFDLCYSGGTNADNNMKDHQLNKEDQSSNFVDKKNSSKVGESNKGEDNPTLEKIEGDCRDDVSKKTNDGKCLRAFKFALAEFVKELLKPTWKEGQINKEAHKTIVRKVVGKVTTTVKGIHIPQSQEKIDSYLSNSKPKLSKLVQAYVEKLQKEKLAVP